MAPTDETTEGCLAKLPRVGKCCQCIELRTGTIILGVLGIVGFLLWFVILIPVVLPLLKKKQEWSVEITETDYTDITDMAAVLVGLGISIMLLIGAINRKPILLKMYIILSLIGCVYMILGVIIKFFTGAPVTQVTILMTVFQAYKVVCSLILEIYFLSCINSYLQQILEEKPAVVPENEQSYARIGPGLGPTLV